MKWVSRKRIFLKLNVDSCCFCFEDFDIKQQMLKWYKLWLPSIWNSVTFRARVSNLHLTSRISTSSSFVTELRLNTIHFQNNSKPQVCLLLANNHKNSFNDFVHGYVQYQRWWWLESKNNFQVNWTNGKKRSRLCWQW